MRKQSKRLSQRECIMGFVTLAVIVYGYFTYWYSVKQKAVVEIERKISLIQNEINQNKAIVDGLQKRIIASTDPGQVSSPIKEYMSASRRIAQVVEKLIAEDPVLSTRSISIEKVEQADEHKLISFSLELVGSFPAMGAFVERLESSKVLTEIRSIDISRIESDLEKCVAKISLNSRIYSEDEE